MKCNISNKKQSGNIFKNISLETKACVYIFLMGLIGGAVGAVGTEVKAQDMNNNVSESDAKVQQIAIAAVAGMSTATFISLPALFKKD